MNYMQTDPSRELILDGNALAGVLSEIFDREMTICPAQCAHCGQEGEIGTLLAFIEGPGLVLRCPGCEGIIMRIVKTSNGIYLDLRGAAYLRLEIDQ